MSLKVWCRRHESRSWGSYANFWESRAAKRSIGALRTEGGGWGLEIEDADDAARGEGSNESLDNQYLALLPTLIA